MDNTQVRLCLEFDHNKNLFFYGKLNKDGSCEISIPKLTELNDRQGRMAVEVIADSVFFRLYECDVELKNAVDIKMKEDPNLRESTKISLKDITQEGKVPEKRLPDFKKRKLPF